MAKQKVTTGRLDRSLKSHLLRVKENGLTKEEIVEVITVEIAEKKAAQRGAPVYLYHFGYKSEMKIPGTDYAIGTPHAMDITFKFNNETPANNFDFLSGKRPDRFIASHSIPTSPNIPNVWPCFRTCWKVNNSAAPRKTCSVTHP